MGVGDVLALGRTRALERMRDACRITSPGSGDRVFNPVTRKYEDPAPALVYEGPCRVPTGGGQLARNGAADMTFNVGEYPLDLPVTPETVNVGPGMTVHYLSAPDNPSLEGMVFGVTEQLLLSQGTKLRFKIKTVVSL